MSIHFHPFEYPINLLPYKSTPGVLFFCRPLHFFTKQKKTVNK